MLKIGERCKPMIYRHPNYKLPSTVGFEHGANTLPAPQFQDEVHPHPASGDTLQSFGGRKKIGIVNPQIGDHTEQIKQFLQDEYFELGRQCFAKIEQADGRPALFLPFVGETGWRLMWHIKLVHLSRATFKVVCCKLGEECLYPSADDFAYGWTFCDNDKAIEGTGRIQREWWQIRKNLPYGHDLKSGLFEVHPEISLLQENVAPLIQAKIPIAPSIRRGLKTDFVIATRKRDLCPENNYPHWPIVADWLQSKGLSFAVIGAPNTSFDLEGSRYYTAEPPDPFNDQWYGFDAAVELLQNCRCFLGTDSGPAHLAAAVNSCPMIVQQCRSHNGREKVFITSMRMTTTRPFVAVPYENWNYPFAENGIIDILTKWIERGVI